MKNLVQSAKISILDVKDYFCYNLNVNVLIDNDDKWVLPVEILVHGLL